MSHTTSKTWVSEETKEFESWTRIRDSMTYVAPRSPFVPATFKAWLSHKLLRKEEDKRKMAQKLIIRQSKGNRLELRADEVLRGKTPGDNLGLVLAVQTIWRPEFEGNVRPNAPWPTHDEYKHEGDDRSRSGYSRFPPLPREPANDTVNWKHRKPLSQYPFDEVGKRMNKGYSGDEIGIEFAVDCVGRMFIREIDCEDIA